MTSREVPQKSTSDDKTTVVGKPDISLISAGAVESFNDTVGFHSDGKILLREFDTAPEDIRLCASLHPRDEYNHSIETILSRPVKIENETFATTSVPGSFIDSIDIINVLRKHSSFDLIRDKLAGFYGFHATAHLKVTFNAQPFESGLFHIFYIPYRGYSHIAPASYTTQEAALPFSTGCPNVYCNVSLQSEVELVVPYTGPFAFVNLTNENADFGSFYIQSIVPLRDSSTKATCELSVYMYFTDVKLFGATPKTMWTAQGEAEVEAARKAGQPANPSIRSALSDLAAAGTQKVLDLVGLSKPLSNQTTERMAINPYGSPATVDATSTAIKMSMQAQQNTTLGQLGVDKVDEMDITHFIAKPTYLGQFQWKTSLQEGKQIGVLYVEPNGSLTTKQKANNEELLLMAPTRLRYMANCFCFWRGTNRFTFQVVGTKFHSGRLRFVYSLGGDIDEKDLLRKLPYSYSQVIDVRDSMAFAIDCPYFAPTAWRNVPSRFSEVDGKYIPPDRFGQAFSTAPNKLYIFVENQLRASENVCDFITIAVFQSGCADYEFAAPHAPLFLPCNFAPEPERPKAATEGKKEKRSVLDLMKPVRGVPQGEAELDYPVISMCDTSLVGMNAEASTLTTGEKITNIRTMLKRYALLGNCKMESGKAYLWLPWNVKSPYRYNISSKVAKNTDVSYDYLTYFYPLYRFYRGGMRLMVASKDKMNLTFRYEPMATNIGPISLEKFDVAVGKSMPIYRGIQFKIPISDEEARKEIELGDEPYPISATLPVNCRLSGGAEIEVPYAHRFHKSVVVNPVDNLASYHFAEDQTYPPGVVYFALNKCYNDTKGEAMSASFYRAVADDFNFGYLVGAPLVARVYHHVSK